MRKARFIFNRHCLSPLLGKGITATYSPGSYAPRLYSFQIYEGAELKRDFVPCVSATEGAGLWDCVEGKFCPNKGGTAFNTP